MDDKAIRGILIEWLQANYPEGHIYQEKSIGESVCDVMLVSDCLTGFEIKSDRDSYRRLPRQVEYYQQYFDYNYLVVGERHGASAGAKIPDNWGIIVVCEDGINLKRKPKYGSPRLEKQLRILWKAELNNILSRLNVPLMTYKSKDYIVRYLAETQESKELQEKIHEGVVYELLHRDYDTLGIGDPTVSGEAKDSSIYCEMPVSEMIDTLSEQDLQQFTLDHWIELYAKARKLKEAKVYKYKKPGRERVSSVEHTIKYKDIEATPGVPWMDRRIINEFIFYLINGYEIWESKGRQNYNLVNYEPNTGYWFIPDKGYYSGLSRIDFEYGIPQYNALYIFESMLNMREIRRDTKKETVLILEKRDKILELFRKWLWEDEDRRWDVEESYNKIFGGLCVKHYDGANLSFPQMSEEIKLYPYQKDAVQRIINEKNTLLAFDVGAGKTYIMIAAAMKMRQMGLSRKNMFVVPNNIVGQWELIFQTMYPKAKLLSVNPGTFQPDVRQKVLNQIVNGDYDGIIIAYSCFEMIPLSSECVLTQMEDDLSKLEDMMALLRQAVGLGKELNRVEEGIRKTAHQLIMSMQSTRTEVTFDKLEINTLFVDEAHNFKNIPIDSRQKNIAGINLRGSQKCLHMQRKVRCVQEQNNGGGVVFATGTPLCNSISDAYAMQMYLQPDVMRRAHLDVFDNWVKSFAQPEYVCEIDVDTSNFRIVKRFARFFNLPELSRLFANIACFYAVNGSGDLPEFSGYDDILLEKSPQLQEYMNKLCERTEEIRKKKIDKGYDNMLKVSTDGRKAALDMRLVGCDELPESRYRKTDVCAEQVMKIYEEYPGCAQIIFCDYSTPKTGQFNVYAEMKSLLVERGMPQEEIAFVHSYTSEATRVALYEKVNRGIVRVLIGSTFKLGIGANVQTKLKAVHHLDAPWRPADMVQREGRIMRKGNLNEEIRIFRYITKGSFDSYSWQILETKQRFISQFLSGSTYQRSASDLEENVLTYAQVKALSISEPLMKTLAEKQNELRHTEILSSAFEKNINDANRSVEEKKKMLDDFDVRLRNTVKNEEYLLGFSREQYKQEVGKIKDFLSESVIRKEEPMPDDLFVMDFAISVPENQDEKNPYLSLKRLDTVYRLEVGQSVSGNARRLYNFFDSFSKQKEQIEDSRKKLRASIKELEAIADQKNPYPEQIAALRDEVSDLEQGIAKKASD